MYQQHELCAAAIRQDGAHALAETETPQSRPVILVVSFGTSYSDTRAVTIEAIEAEVARAFPEYQVRRAFTSRMIIQKLRDRDGIEIDTVTGAMERLIQDGVKNAVVQPTHVMNGFEYDDMMAQAAHYVDRFESIKFGKPLLTGAQDYIDLVHAMAAEFPEPAENEVFVLMGHGTQHFANAAYPALDYVFKAEGYQNVFVGAVEGYPAIDTVMKGIKKFAATKVNLLPLMIVAGDHAANDMNGDDEGSWKRAFQAEGHGVECILRGLGEYEGIRAMFLAHIREAIKGESIVGSAHKQG